MHYDWQGNEITVEQWARLFEDERHVGDDRVGDAHVSTVWIGLDLGFGTDGLPLIFETMIFGGEHNEDTWRYGTEREAREGHQLVVDALREGRSLGDL